MIRSMTGYAEAAAHEGGWSLSVSIRAINHRYLDLQFRLPAELAPAEANLKRQVRERVSRGRLEIQARMESTDGRPIRLDRELVDAVFEIFEQVRRERGLEIAPDLTSILRMPGVMQQGAGELQSDQVQLLTTMTECAVQEAVARLNEMRDREGAALEEEFRSGLRKLDEARQAIAELCQSILPAQRERLQEKMRELVGDGVVDEARLAEEAAYRAERGDIREELTRLASHTAQFQELLSAGDAVGKRLDFLLQEMNREANTILSKTPGLGEQGLEITRLGLDIKSEIERLREQAQNVE